MARTELPNGIILPAEYSDDWYDDMTSNLSKLDEVIGSDAEKLSAENVGAAALSNDYDDLDNKPSIPTKTSDLTNDSNFVDNTDPAVASGITSAKVTSYDSHIADTDIHVTTADKNRWNNQTYVFRYSGTAVVPNSTIAYSTIDNTDNIKSGDKILDVDGKLFEITAVDTTNQTVTVGTALIDLALDANVVHTSGNETISGAKTFTDNIVAKKIVSNVSQLQINAKTNADSIAMIGGDSASDGGGVWVYGKNTSNKSMVTLQVYDTDNSAYHAVRLNMDGSLTPTVSNNGLGSSSYKWVSFNGLTPSSLSFPDFSNRVDIAGYISNLSGNTNTYTPPVNGWLYVGSNDASYLALFDTGSGGSGIRFSDGVVGEKYACIPCQASRKLGIKITCTNLVFAYFVPCHGNI